MVVHHIPPRKSLDSHCTLCSIYIFCPSFNFVSKTAADAAKYRYRLEFFNKEHTKSLAVSLLARSLHEDLNEIHNSGNCVKLYPEQFNRFANEGNELAFSMEIVTVAHNYLRCLYSKT